MISCPACDRGLPSAAQNCRCGWQKSMRGPVPKVPERIAPSISREDARAAYERHRAELEQYTGGTNRTRAQWIEHWLKIQAHPKSLYTAQCAEEALHNLGYRGNSSAAEMAQE